MSMEREPQEDNVGQNQKVAEFAKYVANLRESKDGWGLEEYNDVLDKAKTLIAELGADLPTPQNNEKMYHLFRGEDHNGTTMFTTVSRLLRNDNDDSGLIYLDKRVYTNKYTLNDLSMFLFGIPGHITEDVLIFDHAFRVHRHGSTVFKVVPVQEDR